MPMKNYSDDPDVKKYQDILQSKINAFLNSKLHQDMAMTDLSEKSGFTKDHLGKMRNKTTKPSFASLIKVAIAMGKEPAELLLPDDMVILKKTELAEIPAEIPVTMNRLASTFSLHQKKLLKRILDIYLKSIE